MGPIDYTMQVLDPIQAMLSTYAQSVAEGAQRRQMDQQDVSLGQGQQRIDMAQEQMMFERQQAAQAQAQQQAEAARQAAAEDAMVEFLIKPNKTADDAVAAMRANPAAAAQIQQFWQGIEAGQKEGELKFGKQMLFALNKDPEIAKQMLDARIAEAEAKGDAQQADVWRSQRMMIDAGPEGVERIKGVALMTLGAEMDPKELQSLMEVAGMGGANLDDQKTQAEIAKITAETDKLRMDMANPDPGEDAFDREKKLRDEYVKLTGEYTVVRDAYRKIDAALDSAPGDLSLIFSYMKMLDPGSVVRESEFATAQNAAGVPDQIRNAYNRALTGERLGEKQRSEFRAQAESLMTAASLRDAEVKKGLDPIIQQYRLNPENIFGVGGDGGQKTTTTPTAPPKLNDAYKKITDAVQKNGGPLTMEQIKGLLTPEELSLVQGALK
jgi:hypothetical protein